MLEIITFISTTILAILNIYVMFRLKNFESSLVLDRTKVLQEHRDQLETTRGKDLELIKQDIQNALDENRLEIEKSNQKEVEEFKSELAIKQLKYQEEIKDIFTRSREREIFISQSKQQLSQQQELMLFQRKTESLELMFVALRRLVYLIRQAAFTTKENMGPLIEPLNTQAKIYFDASSKARLYMEKDLIEVSDKIFKTLNDIESSRKNVIHRDGPNGDAEFLLGMVLWAGNLKKIEASLLQLETLETEFRDRFFTCSNSLT